MSNVEFDGDYNQTSAQSIARSSSQNFRGMPAVNQGGMAGWMVKKGIIQEESQAKGILLGLVVFNLIATALVIYFIILK